MAAFVLTAACIVDDPSYLGASESSSAVASGSTTTPIDTTGSSATSLETTITQTGDGTSDSTNTTSSLETTDDGDESGGCSGWWDLSWNHRHRLALATSELDEDLDAFTALVTLDVRTFDYAQAAADGSDLRFVDEDGTTELPHHIEHWDPAGISQVWVRVPRIESGDPDEHLWLYYDNDAAEDAQDPANSHDEHHAGVWHLSEVSGLHLDTTAGIPCTWTAGASGTQDAPGQIAGANEFGGSSAVDCGTTSLAGAIDHTITAWARLSLVGSARQSIVVLEDFGAPYSGPSLYVRRNDGAVGTWHEGTYVFSTSTFVAADQWSLLAVRGHLDAGAGSIEVSVDGSPWDQLVSGDTTNLALLPTASLVVGSWLGPGPGANATGFIDEVRVSTTLRSQSWIRAQTLAGQGLLVTVEGNEDQASVCP